MRNAALPLFSLFVLVLAGAAPAGETLAVRLVKATSGPSGRVDSQLGNVAPALERSLAYTGYAVVGSLTQPLPADGKSRSLGAYRVTCAGPQKQLAILVQEGGRSVLRTRVVLGDRKPLILGGLAADKGALMLVFEAQ